MMHGDPCMEQQLRVTFCQYQHAGLSCLQHSKPASAVEAVEDSEDEVIRWAQPPSALSDDACQNAGVIRSGHEWMKHTWFQPPRNAAAVAAGGCGQAGAIGASASQTCGQSGCMGGALTGWAASQPAKCNHKAAWYVQLSTARVCNIISSCA